MISRYVLVVSGLCGVLLSVFLYRHSPETVATHFGLGGEPNGWAGRTVGVLVIGAGMHLFFTALFLMMPVIMRVVPIRLVNLPHKEYWLASERRERTIGGMTRSLCVFGSATNLFLIVVQLLAHQANLRHPVRLDETAVFVALGAFLCFMAMWMIRFYRRYRKPAEE